jgi:hypothetical protein
MYEQDHAVMQSPRNTAAVATAAAAAAAAGAVDDCKTTIDSNRGELTLAEMERNVHEGTIVVRGSLHGRSATAQSTLQKPKRNLRGQTVRPTSFMFQHTQNGKIFIIGERFVRSSKTKSATNSLAKIVTGS